MNFPRGVHSLYRYRVSQPKLGAGLLLQQTCPRRKKRVEAVDLNPFLFAGRLLQVLEFPSQAPTSEIDRPGTESKYPGHSPLVNFGQPMHDVQR